DAVGVEGATLISHDEDRVEFDRTTSKDAGWYRVNAPSLEQTFVQVEGEGLVPTGASGLPGGNPRLRVPNGTFVAVSEAALAELRVKWAGCPGVDDDGAVLGRVELAEFEQTTGERIILQTAELTLQIDGGARRAACYLGADGTYDPDVEVTGPSGEFLITSVPGGLHQLDLIWVPVGGTEDTQTYSTWVPEGGLAPRFPLLVESPIEAL
ncbi:MAG: hypothetical protein AB8H79_14340, partial [Myxococcota bacterium]